MQVLHVSPGAPRPDEKAKPHVEAPCDPMKPTADAKTKPRDESAGHSLHSPPD